MLTNEQKANLLKMLPKMREILPRQGGKINAIECSIAYLKVYDERIDWHEFSWVLDAWHTLGLLKTTKPGGMIEYALAAAPVSEIDWEKVFYG
jgi:hypothetical protein